MTDTTTIQETKVLWDTTADKLYVWDGASKAWELFFVAADLVTNDALTADLALKVSVAGDAMSGALELPNIGINTVPDSTNKVAVKSSTILFDNIGNGVQAKVNKNGAADTASVLYQTGYSGRAEIGLCGDDNFHFKVSPDGSSWNEAIQIDKTTGIITLAGVPTSSLHAATKGYVDGAVGAPSGTANKVYATPNGSTGAASLRALVGADLPAPGASSLGGIESLAAVAHKWINAISTAGVPSAAQPAMADISDFATGSWTPTDASGAGLTLTHPSTSYYFKIGKVVVAQGSIGYPVTADASNAVIGSLPYAVSQYAAGIVFSAAAGTAGNSPSGIALQGTSTFGFYKGSGGALSPLTNAIMSNGTTFFTCVYITP